MMLPVSRRFEGGPVAVVTGPAPSPYVWTNTWFHQATPPFLIYHTPVWLQAVEVVPIFYRPQLHPIAKLMCPEEVTVFQRRDKPRLLTNHSLRRTRGHAPKPKPKTHLRTGSGYNEWAGLQKGAWPILLTTHTHTAGAAERFGPITGLQRRLAPPIQMLKEGRPSLFSSQMFREIHPSFFSSKFTSSTLTLLTNYTHKRRRRRRAEIQTGGETGDDIQCNRDNADENEDDQKDKRPVASTPVPGSPWCVVWTADDQVFFFNPSINLSVWDKPSDLIGRDVVCSILQDPPHKRKRKRGRRGSPGIHGNKDAQEEEGEEEKEEEEEEEEGHRCKKNRLEQCEKKLLPLDLRVAHFRSMMLDREVSAFSSWEKQLHKMVFDSRYLLLDPAHRRQVFEEFTKSRMKEEYKEKKKEKKNKLQKARQTFRQLLQEAHINTRCTFKQFCARYRDDRRFTALDRKQEQEVLFSHYITSLRRRDKHR